MESVFRALWRMGIEISREEGKFEDFLKKSLDSIVNMED